jgi:hypothetical protein
MGEIDSFGKISWWSKKHSIGLLFAIFYALVRIIVRRLEKLNIPLFQASHKIMTLIRLVQRASILAGMTFSSLPFQSNPARAEITEFCVVASNGKTVCGKSRGIERMCITTDGSNTVCGKFKSAKEGQEEERKPASLSGYRKEVDNFVLTLESCKRVDEDVRCQMKILNKGKTRLVGLRSDNSSIVDVTGRSYPGSQTDFGTGSNFYQGTNIESKNDLIISITFNKIPGQIVKAQLFNLAFGGEMKPIQFRNVPISN